MSAIEITAHDIETAIKTGMAQLNLLRAEAKIEVLDEGNKGVLGIGARPARVRLTPYAEIEAAESAADAAARAVTPPAPDRQAERQVEPPAEEPVYIEPVVAEPPADVIPVPDPAATAPMAEAAGAKRTVSAEDVELAAALAQGVLERMNLQVTCASRIISPAAGDDNPSVWVDIQGKDASGLLAHQCEALDALQLVVQTMWAHQTKSGLRVTLDADSYKERREKRIRQMALRLAEGVISSGRAITLEPMPPSERRLVHIALRDHPRVTTESHGEGSGRRITIKLK